MAKFNVGKAVVKKFRGKNFGEGGFLRTLGNKSRNNKPQIWKKEKNHSYADAIGVSAINSPRRGEDVRPVFTPTEAILASSSPQFGVLETSRGVRQFQKNRKIIKNEKAILDRDSKLINYGLGATGVGATGVGGYGLYKNKQNQGNKK